MNRLRKMSFLTVIMALAMLLCGAVSFGVSPVLVGNLSAIRTCAATNEILIGVVNTGSFENDGVYICRAPKVSAENLFWGSVSAENIINSFGLESFNPNYEALVRHRDRWEKVQNDDFYLSSDYEQATSDKRSIIWNLKETAPAGVYGVRCTFVDNDNLRQEYIYQILYTDQWTYITALNEDGESSTHNFYGGTSRTLKLRIYYNEGATVPGRLDEGTELPNGAKYGRLKANEIIATENMAVSLRTLDGQTYEGEIEYDVIDNEITLRFNEQLYDDLYVLKIYSAADNGRIYAQFIIDNQGAAAGINLSKIWILVVILGAVLILFSVVAFFLPFIIVKINSERVYKENLRINRMKNPDAYAVQKSGTLMQRVKNKLNKLVKRKNSNQVEDETPETPVVENTEPGRQRFTDMIREKRETRNYMQEYGVSSDKADEMKQAEAEQDNAKKSFAFLRDDDDDEIASLHEEKDEVSTIETNSYTQDGATFAKLDSMQDDHPDDNNQ